MGEEGIDGRKGNSRERENEGASLLIGEEYNMEYSEGRPLPLRSIN